MHCCKRTNDSALDIDSSFAEDDFTQAALRERRARAAHAHGLFGLFAVIGGLLLFGLIQRR